VLRLRLVDVVAARLRVQRLITRLTDARRLVYLIVFGVQRGPLLVYCVYNMAHYVYILAQYYY